MKKYIVLLEKYSVRVEAEDVTYDHDRNVSFQKREKNGDIVDVAAFNNIYGWYEVKDSEDCDDECDEEEENESLEKTTLEFIKELQTFLNKKN